jgi:hypothetical protein
MASARRLLRLGGAALLAADEIDGGAEFEERIGGGLDSIDTGDGIEDDVLLLGEIVRQGVGQLDDA